MTHAKLVRLAKKVAKLPPVEQGRFLALVVRESCNPSKTSEVMIRKGLEVLNSNRIVRLEMYMEKIFTKNPERTPSSAAYQTMYYFKINPRMKPFLTAVARRVKRRVKARIRRKEEKSGE